MFLVASALLGVFIGVGQGYRFAAAERVAPALRNRAMALTLLGGVLAAWGGPWLAAWSAGQALPFVYGYGLLLPLVLLVGLTLGRLDFAPTGAAPGATSHSASHSASHCSPHAGPPMGAALFMGIVGYGLMGLLMNGTPIAMLCAGHEDFGLTARVIQWHVVAMYAPSLITGRLIDRWGAWPVLLAGGVFNGAAMAVNLSASTLPAFELALSLLGVGWNLLYVGASSLIGQSPEPLRRARLQGWHDMGCFGLMGLVTLGVAPLVRHWGWENLNLLALPWAGLLVLVAARQCWQQWQEARPARLKTGQTA
jgi:MFS family permease